MPSSLCVCGRPALIVALPGGGTTHYVVACVDPQCWRGPTRATESEAVMEWERGAERRNTLVGVTANLLVNRLAAQVRELRWRCWVLAALAAAGLWAWVLVFLR